MTWSRKQEMATFCYRLIQRQPWKWAMKARRVLLSVMMRRKVNELFIFEDVLIDKPRELVIGDHVSIHRGTHMACHGGLVIGNYVAIGHRCSIITTNHAFTDTSQPMKYQPLLMAPVVIEDDVWIGANVTILAGVHIARGSIIAAGSVVTRSVSRPGSIVGGVPAHLIKLRTQPESAEQD